jgi:hypothetical protein
LVKLRYGGCCCDVCNPIADAEVISDSIPPEEERAVRWHYSSDGDPTNWMALQTTPSGLRERHDRMEPRWQLLTHDGVAKDSSQQPGVGPELRIDNQGSRIGTRSPWIRRGTLQLPGGPSVELDRRHRGASYSAVLSGGDAILVVSVVDVCDCGDPEVGPIFKHVASLVDRRTGQARMLFHGAGDMVVGEDGEGAVYLQRWADIRKLWSVGASRDYLDNWDMLGGDPNPVRVYDRAQAGGVRPSVRRWPSLDKLGSEPGEEILPGVLLRPFRLPPQSCCSA